MRYAYDKLSRLVKVIDVDGGVTTYQYDAVGNRIKVTYPNGTYTKYTYDALNRLVRLENRRGNDLISSYDYELGPVGNRVRIVEKDGVSADTLSYQYDSVYRLVKERRSGGYSYEIEYEYDAVGNRLKKIMDTDTTKYLYNDRDQLLKEVLGSDTTEYSYDANGNTTQKLRNSTTINYSYDSENRLLEADSNNVLLAKYEYDSDGNRIRKITPADTINFLIDPNQMLAQVIAEYDNLGNIIVSYLYGDDLISQKRNNIKSFYHYDGLGSTRVLTDVNGIITDTYIFYAFGELLAKTGNTINTYLFTGEQYDPNLGFYYLRARLYNPAIGRFLTIDPFDGTLYDPMSLHKYLYCNADPVNKTDRSGMFTLMDLNLTNIIKNVLIHIAWMAIPPIMGNFALRFLPEEWFKDPLSAVRFGITGSVVAGTSWWGGGFTSGIDILVFPITGEVAFYGYLGGTFGNPGVLVAAEAGGAFGLYNDSKRWGGLFISLNFYHRLPSALVNLPQKVTPFFNESKQLLLKVATDTAISDTFLGLIMKTAANYIQEINLPASLSLGASFTISQKEYDGVKPCAFSVGTGELSTGRTWGLTVGYTVGIYSSEYGWWFASK